MYCAFVCHSMSHVALTNSPKSWLAAIPSTTVCLPCTISHAIPFLRWLLLRYQSVLSLCAPVYLVLSISAISPCTLTGYPVLSVSPIPLYNYLLYAISLCYPCLHLSTLCFLSLPSFMLSNWLPCAINLCYPPLQLSTLCYQSVLSLFTPVYPVLSISVISHALQLATCAISLCYPPLQLTTPALSVSVIPVYNCLPCAISLCYFPLQLSTPCF